jgi:hypothetical protein
MKQRWTVGKGADPVMGSSQRWTPWGNMEYATKPVLSPVTGWMHAHTIIDASLERIVAHLFR